MKQVCELIGNEHIGQHKFPDSSSSLEEELEYARREVATNE